MLQSKTKSSRGVSPRRARQKGSAIVESTICFLGFIFLMLGMVELSMAVYAYNFVAYAANDAAHYAAVHGSQSSTPVTADALQTRVRDMAVALTHENVTVTTTWLPNNTPGSAVDVRVAYTFSPIVNLVIRSNMDLNSTSRMYISN